jgi:imidazolonepropionase-like amidohydrolase
LRKAFSCESIIDANGVRHSQVIVIEGSRIVEVQPKSQFVEKTGIEYFDYQDLTVLPGFIDCHVHFEGVRHGDNMNNFQEDYESRLLNAAFNELPRLIEAGFTSVMDAGGLVGLHLRNAVNKGVFKGPRIFAAGRYISQTAGRGDTHYLPLEWVKEGRSMGWWPADGRIADGVDECVRAVREQLRVGCDFVKIASGGGWGSHYDPAEYPQYTVKELKVMVNVAHSWRRKVMSHAHYPRSIINASCAGVDLLTHCTCINEKALEVLCKNEATIIPTMSGGLMSDPGLSYEGVRKMYEAKLTLALGTDTFGYPLRFGENAKELELYVNKIGVTPLEAIKIATLNGAKAMGINDIGTVEAGKIADIIFINGNPLEDISVLQDLEKIKLVFRNGEVLKDIT